MRAIKKYSELIIVTIIALFFSTLNLAHVLYWAFHTPGDKIFIGITHWYEDYFFYLSLLTQGAMGKWHLANLYSLEHIPIGFNWGFNLILGKFAPLFNIPVWTVYDGAIYVLSIVYIFVLYKIIWAIFPNEKFKRIGTLLIALTSTNFLTISSNASGQTLAPITFFYAYTSAFNRFGGIAHHLFQNILTVSCIYIFSQILEGVKHKKNMYVPKIFLLAFLLSCLMTTSTFYVATDLLIFALASLYFLYLNRSVSAARSLAFTFTIASIPIAIMGVSELTLLRDPFWQFVRQWEASRAGTNIQTFLLSMGLIVLLMPFGLRSFFKHATILRIIGTVWGFVPIILYFTPIPTLVGSPSFRLLQPPAYIFFGAIALEGLSAIAEFISLKFNLARRAIFFGLVILFIVFQIPGIVIEIQSRTNEYYLNSHLNFIDRDVYEGLLFLKKQPHDKNVLAVNTLESLVPVISGHMVYEGHATITMDYKNKINNTIAFYFKKMTPEEGYTLLVSNTIGYVLWEKRFNQGQSLQSYYPFLTVAYENAKLLIYTVQ